jgi:cytochrome c peroxidase
VLATACSAETDLRGTDGTHQKVTALVSAMAVGEQLFFDASLSEPAGQACATCHDPTHAFADSRGTATSEGAVAGRFGGRNAPSIVYASFVQPLHAAGDETGYTGGLFWDGRARTLEDQAGGPLLNPLEMNNADRAAVVQKIETSAYANDFRAVFGDTIFNDTDQAFSAAMHAIAEYERTGIAGRFSSKYDAFLAGKATLSDAETRGLAIFEDTKRGNCASCHLDKPSADGTAPLFTDFGYDNLGIPKNESNPFYALPATLNPDGAAYVDNGLGGSAHNPRQFGKFKAPSLRNVALTAPYGHNGYFADLRSIVRFYNDRDVPSAGWSASEVDAGKNTTDMGNLGLSDADIDDLVAFLLTLTDGFVPDTAAHEAEPNDTRQNATPLTADVAMDGSVATVSDVDWFRIDVVAGASVDVHLGKLSADCDLRLYSASGKLVAVSDNSDTEDEDISGVAKNTTYYVKVYAGAGEPCTYELTTASR